jgi:hypothetical protein
MVQLGASGPALQLPLSMAQVDRDATRGLLGLAHYLLGACTSVLGLDQSHPMGPRM